MAQSTRDFGHTPGVLPPRYFGVSKQRPVTAVPAIGGCSTAPVYAIRTHEDLDYVASVTRPRSTLPFGEYLLESGVVVADDLKDALDVQRQTQGRRIGWILKKLGCLDDAALSRLLAAHGGIPCVSLAGFTVSGDFRPRIPEPATREHGVAIIHEDSNKAWLAAADVTDACLFTEVKSRLRRTIALVMAPHSEIAALMQ